MGALAYLEFRYALHRAQAILRSPLRLVVWVPYLFFVVYVGYSRFARHHAASPAFDVLPTLATAIAGAYLALLGTSTALAAGGRVAAFRSPAEAVLFSNAGVRPLTIAAWLQLRKIASSPMRWLGGFIYIFAIAAPKDASPFAVVRALVVVGLLVGLAMSIELPAFLLGRGRSRLALRSIGWTVAAIGAMYGIAGLLGTRVLVPLDDAVHFDPGDLVRALLQGDALAVCVLALVLATLAFAVAVLGDDALPELYAASLGVKANRARRERTATPDYLEPGASETSRIPSGAYSLVWKDWVAFRRARGSLRIWIVGAIAWTACGVAVGVARTYWNDASPIFTLVCGSAVLVLVIAPFNASVGLAADLSKPLFWLNAAPLRTCIAAWTAGRSWRGGIVLGLAPSAAGIVTGDIALALLSMPLSICAYWSLQALGVVLYALFPDPVDVRGPMMLLRLFITTLYIVPALIAYGAIGIFLNYDVYALAAAAGLLLAQGFGAIEIAASRFREYGASLATLSKAA